MGHPTSVAGGNSHSRSVGMRLVRTQGRGGKETRQILNELELRGARNTARAMPVVQRIVADVRKGGDRALRRYAAKLDGLAPRQPLEISRRRWSRPGRRRPSRFRRRCRPRQAISGDSPARQMPKQWSATARRAYYRATGAGAGRGRVLRAQRALSLALYPAHDGDPGAGGRGGANRGGVAKAGQGDTGGRVRCSA